MPLIIILGRQRQKQKPGGEGVLCEFKGSLNYILSSRPGRATTKGDLSQKPIIIKQTKEHQTHVPWLMAPFIHLRWKLAGQHLQMCVFLSPKALDVAG